MIDRCYRKRHEAWRRYGGLGIKVCDEWRGSFPVFFASMGPRPSGKYSLDRIDNDGDYTALNCRWATLKEQHRNTSTNRFLTISGESKTISEWAELSGVRDVLIHQRIANGWPTDRLLIPPTRCARKFHITWKGKTQTTRQWADETGISIDRIGQRYKSGLPLDLVFTSATLIPRKNSISNRERRIA